MTHEQIAIIALLIAQALTLYFLWLAKEESDHWRTMWLRDSAELLKWKRNGIMRDHLHDMTAYEVYELAQWKR